MTLQVRTFIEYRWGCLIPESAGDSEPFAAGVVMAVASFNLAALFTLIIN